MRRVVVSVLCMSISLISACSIVSRALSVTSSKMVTFTIEGLSIYSHRASIYFYLVALLSRLLWVEYFVVVNWCPGITLTASQPWVCQDDYQAISYCRETVLIHRNITLIDIAGNHAEARITAAWTNNICIVTKSRTWSKTALAEMLEAQAKIALLNPLVCS